MANITIYKVEPYNSKYYRIFSGVYNDFKNNAATDYNFELSPLEYDKFIKSVEKGLLNCLILFEDNIPTGFLAYTTVISESLELNIIHCIGTENLNAKRKLLLEKFIEQNKLLMRSKVVTYPMLGKQSSFVADIARFGFKTVNTSVMVFNLSDISAINKTKEMYVPELEKEYSITNWQTIYSKDVAEVIHQAFKDSSDALFDSRFKSLNGAKDILEKITNNVYGQFLPGITKVLLYKKRPIGVCFANLTNEEIANVPIVAILKKHRHKGFGKILLKHLVDSLLTSSISGGWGLKELNASCDSDNIAAVNMYTTNGFTESYSYPQAYHSALLQ
ncbi:GNAT family N-acetyltransferase [bacterium]|nr:GNAT family N-acetyltransferase [bacterium]